MSSAHLGLARGEMGPSYSFFRGIVYLSVISRLSSSMAFDNKRQNFILFGGVDNSSEPYSWKNDTWRYNYSTNMWTNITPAINPPVRETHTMAYDMESDRIIMFGGYNSSLFFNDTWAYDPNTNTWTNMSPQVSPSARVGSMMVYDNKSNRIILFGGWTGNYMNDTWTYDYNTNSWTNLTSTKQPPPERGWGYNYVIVDHARN
jgi:N-acetylneuraminic acid mutarotase